MPARRIEKEFTTEDFEKLCHMQCTKEEIAAFFDMSDDTLTNRVRDHYSQSFADVYQQKRKSGTMSLRRAQWQTAIGNKELNTKPNVTMMIWLGKQYLGQADQTVGEHTHKVFQMSYPRPNKPEEKK